MQYGDLVALLVALGAIWFTWRESRRNNLVILKVRECKTVSETSTENRGGITHKLEIWIQNRGISLHDVTVALGFQAENGGGWCNLPLHGSSKHDRVDAEFARGMVAEFYLKSAELGPGDEYFLRMLEDPKKQRACLNVYAQDYFAYSMRIRGAGDKIKSAWNSFASWFNNLFTHSHGLSIPPSPTGTHIIHIPEILPRFVTLEQGVMRFIRAVLHDGERVKKVELVP